MTKKSEKLERIRARAAKVKPNPLIEKIVDWQEKRLGDPYEYQRTCSRCNHVRFVPADLVEAKPRKQAKMAGWATPLVGKARQTIRAEQALVDSYNANLAETSRCPSCGSSAFVDERVPL